MKIINDNLFLILLALAFNVIAFGAWLEYLETNTVYFAKMNVTFVGNNALGYLAGNTLIAAILTLYAIKSMHNSFNNG